MSIVDSIVEFAAAVRRDRKANPEAVGEGAGLELLLAPRFQALVEAVLPEVTAAPLSVLPEFQRPGVGRPDLALKRQGEPARAFIELKQPGLVLDPDRLAGHNADQFERFCGLPLWALCNFTSIRLYRRDALEAEAEILPVAALDPGTSTTRADRLIRERDVSGFTAILQTLAMAAPVTPQDAEEVAAVLAHAARLVRSVVAAQCDEGLDEVVSEVRADFNETLFARAEAGGYAAADTDLGFSSAFAQTLVFGLLLAREAGGMDVDGQAYELLPDASWPLLRGTLRALTLDEVRAMLGVAFDVTVDAVNAVDPVLLSPANGRDPVLYLYENFLRIFDPEAVRRYGVYYTPPEIVRLIVAEVDRSLRGPFQSAGLLDENVQLLDPACGTGTFLIAAAGEAAHQAEERYGEGAVPAEVKAFSRRMHGFELLVGPYAVAHYRMTREVAGRGAAAARLPIFLTDTLAPPADAAGVQPHLAFLSSPMVAERRKADAVKRDAPILVVMGNPPYKRLRAGEARDLIGTDMEERWEDLKQPVRDAGHGLSLNAFPDLYVAFYRWALWRLFEVEGAQCRGVLAFITNRNFLTGRGFGGLRKMLRERFDRIRIVDFRGNTRAVRPAPVQRDQNVFKIETGVCILVAEAFDGGSGQARVEYADVWREGAFTRVDKLYLADAAASDPQRFTYRPVQGEGMDRLTPACFFGRDWPALNGIFDFASNGIVTYRDDFVYATEAELLERRLLEWRGKDRSKAQKEFRDSAANKVGPALEQPFDSEAIAPISYRPFDIRYLYNHPNFVDRPRHNLQEVWGADNVALFAKGDGTGGGPAVWCHGLLPDQHAFRGSYGGWVFPLWDRREGQGGALVNAEFLAELQDGLGGAVGPQEVFDSALALLSSSSYTTRFAWDLEDSFPHIPFPADMSLFRRTVEVGGHIRLLQTFAADPDERFFRGRIQGRVAGPILDVPPPQRAFTRQGDEGTLALTAGGAMRVAGVPGRVWEFTISGYPVLYKWLSARRGQPLNATMHRSILGLVARLNHLMYLFDDADALLEEALEAPLSFGPRWRRGSGAAGSEGEDAETADGSFRRGPESSL